MPDAGKNMAQALAALKKDYLARLPERIAVFAEILRQMERDRDSRELLKRLQEEAHKFHGSAGSYGFPEAGALAREWELKLQSLLEGDKRLAEPSLAEFWTYLQRMERTVKSRAGAVA